MTNYGKTLIKQSKGATMYKRYFIDSFQELVQTDDGWYIRSLKKTCVLHSHLDQMEKTG